jgi:hypothetical protein
MTDEEMLGGFEGMFTDPDTDIRRYEVQVVTTRREHFCPSYEKDAGHTIPAGTRTVKETAIVDGKWASCHTCEECVAKWNKEKGGEDDD